MRDLINRAYRYGEAHVATVALVSLGLGVVLAVLAGYSFFREGDIERRVTKVETPCTKHPASEKCQKVKQRSDEKRSVPSTCVLFYKVDKGGRLLRLTKCAVKRQEPDGTSPAASPAENSPPPIAAAPVGGDAQQPSQGNQTPGPHQGGLNGGGGPSETADGGGEGASPPVAAGNEGTAPPSSSSSSSTTTNETTVVEEASKAPVREAAGGVLEETGEAVNGALCGVTGALQLPCK